MKDRQLYFKIVSILVLQCHFWLFQYADVDCYSFTQIVAYWLDFSTDPNGSDSPFTSSKFDHNSVKRFTIRFVNPLILRIQFF